MNDGTFTIYLKKGNPADGNDAGAVTEMSFSPTGSNGSPNESNGKINSKSGGMVNTVVISAAKRAINWGLSNYGNLTGDYIAQANIQAIIEIGTLAAMATQFPIGTLAAVGSVALKEVDYQVELQKKRYGIEMLQNRTGMMTYSGGRI